MALAELLRPTAVSEHPHLPAREKVEFPREELLRRHKQSFELLLSQQHPESGLLPAAVMPNGNKEAHMDHAWTRDGAIVADALQNPYSQHVVVIDPGQKELVAQGLIATDKWLHGQHAIFGKEADRFKQKIEVVQDLAGKRFRRLTKSAPSIHTLVDGSECLWPEQNQPDSFGFHLITLAGALNRGMELSVKEQIAVKKEVNLLLQRDSTHEQITSMWEWGKVYDPPPLSSVASETRGLSLIRPFMPVGIQKKIRRLVQKNERFIKTKYPFEYTCPDRHYGQTDIATLIAMGHGTINYVDPEVYFTASNPELRMDSGAGAIRYKGDHYYCENEFPNREAHWMLDPLYRAKIAMDMGIAEANKGNYQRAKTFLTTGLQIFQEATDVFDVCGYAVELLYYSGGRLIPNTNHLLWNEAMIVNVSSEALYLDSLLAEAESV